MTLRSLIGIGVLAGVVALTVSLVLQALGHGDKALLAAAVAASVAAGVSAAFISSMARAEARRQRLQR